MNVTPMLAPYTAQVHSVEPQPIPGTTRPDAETYGWKYQKMATIAYSKTAPNKTPSEFSNTYDVGAFVPTSARTLKAAVAEASKAASAQAGVGVLQAKSGRYYLANLIERAGLVDSGVRVDPWSAAPFVATYAYAVKHAVRLDDTLQAIVGRTTWINFTDENISPKLAS